MKESKTERILCRIEYIAQENPKCKVLVGNKTIKKFTADNESLEFYFSITQGPFDFTIEHYGKNMKRQPNKFIEIRKLFFNDIDIKNMIWDTVQVPTMPAWQNYNDYKWEGNLFLGHNASITYKLESPIIDFLFNYHQPSTKVSAGMTSKNTKFMDEMKTYFNKIVQEQKNAKYK